MKSFQDKLKECKNIKSQLYPLDIDNLVDLYYKCEREFLEAYYMAKKQIEFKNSKNRIGLIQFDKSTLDTNLAMFGELKFILRTLSRILNIKPDKDYDKYELKIN